MDDGIEITFRWIEVAGDMVLEVDDAAYEDADCCEHPCLTDETPEDAPSCGSKGPFYTSLFLALPCVHYQRAEYAKRQIDGKEGNL